MNETTLEMTETTKTFAMAPEIAPLRQPSTVTQFSPALPLVERKSRFLMVLLYPLAAAAIFLVIKDALLMNYLFVWLKINSGI